MIISSFVHNSIINSNQNADLSSEEDSHLLLRIPKHSEDSNGFVQDGIILSLRRQESAKSPRPARQNKQLEDDLEAVPLRRQESSLRS
jgi:hypothetical protein